MDNKNWGTRQAPYSLNQYSRAGSSITIEKTPVAIADITVCNEPGVTCINAVFDTGVADFDCTDTTVNGGWGTPTTSGQCWSSLEACYFFGTPSQVCYDLTVAGQNLTSHVANNSIAVSSQCGAPDAKGLCFFENTGAAKIRSNTGDDMFAITNGASGYIEYPALGVIGSDSRLMYIARNGGDPARDVMIPSGPPGTYTDYKSFMSGPPGFMTSEAGCYRLDVDLCQGNITLPPAGPPPLPPVDGLCVAYGGTYGSQPATDDATGCTDGTYSNLSNTGANWRWRCNGVDGGANVNCAASRPAVVVNGSCKAYGATYASQPASNTATGCTDGSYVEAADTATDWGWSCNGSGGGSNASCTASKIVPIVNGACRIYPGPQAVQPATDDATGCLAGAYEDLPDPRSWRWRCNGSGGGTTENCVVLMPRCVLCRTTSGLGVRRKITPGCSSGDADVYAAADCYNASPYPGGYYGQCGRGACP